jgi:thiol-disulfide isomerase/thioredoxin
MGVIAPIKSKTISLTEANFARLVLETNDVWIIQIYEDANPWCEQIGPLWDEIAEEYANTVKFGRINIGTHRSLLKHLPINIVFLPTILSMVKGYDSEIFILSRDFMNSTFVYFSDLKKKKIKDMRKFLLHVIVSKFKYLSPERFRKVYEQTNYTDLKTPEFLYIMRSSIMPIEFKYYAFIVILFLIQVKFN